MFPGTAVFAKRLLKRTIGPPSMVKPINSPCIDSSVLSSGA